MQLPQEVDESTGRALNYSKHDLLVIDWEAAWVASEPRDIEKTLHIVERANPQLTGLG